jgi:hypothetical protein
MPEPKINKIPMFWEDYISHLPVCASLVNNFELIRAEILEHIHKNNPLITYPEYLVNNIPLYHNYWKAFPLSSFSGEFVEISNTVDKKYLDDVVSYNKEKCPVTSRIVSEGEKAGYISNVFVSRLIPNSIINPHTGWSNNWMRVHLCLVEDPNCKITVGTETKAWKTGKLLAFKDGGIYPHSVRHNGTTERIVLSIDISKNYLMTSCNELKIW